MKASVLLSILYASATAVHMSPAFQQYFGYFRPGPPDSIPGPPGSGVHFIPGAGFFLTQQVTAPAILTHFGCSSKQQCYDEYKEFCVDFEQDGFGTCTGNGASFFLGSNSPCFFAVNLNVDKSMAELDIFMDSRGIQFMEENSLLQGADVQSPTTWNLGKLSDWKSKSYAENFSDKYEFQHSPTDGQGVKVYVIDSGFEFAWREGSEFLGGVEDGASFSSGSIQCGDQVQDHFSDAQDERYHGTHVSGIIASSTYGVAKGATIVPVRVMGKLGCGSAWSTIKGLEFAADDCKADEKCVINMSILTAQSQFLDAALRAAREAGLVTVASSGNFENDACLYSPARSPDVITVGSHGKQHAVSWFSNWGACTNIHAPGESVISTVLDLEVNTYSGTSMAAPHVAGLVATMMSIYGKLSQDEVMELFNAGWGAKGILSQPQSRGSPNLVAIRPQFTFEAISSAECPSDREFPLPKCSAPMACNALCEADSPLPDGQNNFEVNNCYQFDVWRKICSNQQPTSSPSSSPSKPVLPPPPQGDSVDPCPLGYRAVPENLDGAGKAFTFPHPRPGRTIQECADTCNNRGCTGFEFAVRGHETGACITYTAGDANRLDDQDRLAAASEWRSCMREPEIPDFVECPLGFRAVPENLDGAGKKFASTSPRPGRTIQECADFCVGLECTGFEFAVRGGEKGRCITYTAGDANRRDDQDRLAAASEWRSCMRSDAGPQIQAQALEFPDPVMLLELTEQQHLAEFGENGIPRPFQHPLSPEAQDLEFPDPVMLLELTEQQHLAEFGENGIPQLFQHPLSPESLALEVLEVADLRTGHSADPCPHQFQAVPENLDGAGKRFHYPHPRPGRTIQECADFCFRHGCTGFEFAVRGRETGACITYTAGNANRREDQNRLAADSKWRSCMRARAIPDLPPLLGTAPPATLPPATPQPPTSAPESCFHSISMTTCVPNIGSSNEYTVGTIAECKQICGRKECDGFDYVRSGPDSGGPGRNGTGACYYFRGSFSFDWAVLRYCYVKMPDSHECLEPSRLLRL